MKLTLILGLVALMTIACGPKCKKAHDETYMVPASSYTTYDYYGYGKHRISVPRQVFEPAHTAIRQVCDEYESAK